MVLGRQNCGVWADLRKSFPGSLKAIEDAKGLVKNSKSKNTVSKYNLFWRKFRQWVCRKFGQCPMPVDPKVIGLYLADLSKSVASTSTLDSALYAIKWAHFSAGLDDPTNNPFPKAVYEGCKRSITPRIPRRPIVQVEIVKMICEAFGMPSNSLRQLRFAAMVVFAFAGFLRIGEVLSLKLGNLVVYEDKITLLIEKSKCDQYGTGSSVVLSVGRTAACPLRIFRLYKKFLSADPSF